MSDKVINRTIEIHNIKTVKQLTQCVTVCDQCKRCAECIHRAIQERVNTCSEYVKETEHVITEGTIS